MDTYIKSLSRFNRRKSNEVKIGKVMIGGDNPIAVQTMTNTNTMDIPACVEQIREIRNADCRIVRLTAPGKREADNLGQIIPAVKRRGIEDMSYIADIHFLPEVALIAADYVDKIRINPGNYRDPDGIKLRELIEKCRSKKVSLRIGVNHGSLSADIVEKWGDTPRGMVESAMEFLRKCRELDFDQIVVSMKSSNVRVMVHAYRLLVSEMDKENMTYPLHLGVTEAGDRADGRIKSAVGIGSLLADGIGDTIRVSLTEPPENEIPVAKKIVDLFFERSYLDTAIPDVLNPELYNPFEYSRRKSRAVGNIGGGNIPVLYCELDKIAKEGLKNKDVVVLESISAFPQQEWRSSILNMMALADERPVILHKKYNETCLEDLQVRAASDFGMLFIDGLADGIWIENESRLSTVNESDKQISQKELVDISLSILQASRVRMSKTEFIACPGCGRTLFNLQETLKDIKARLSHLKTLKIGVMGCIVNGPGEMADADYGYVGAGRNRITLYKGKEVIKRDIHQQTAIEELIQLIKDNGDWIDPE